MWGLSLDADIFLVLTAGELCTGIRLSICFDFTGL